MTLSFLLTSLIVVASPGTGVLYTLAVALTQGARPSVVAGGAGNFIQPIFCCPGETSSAKRSGELPVNDAM